jgi:hypothetical protein
VTFIHEDQLLDWKHLCRHGIQEALALAVVFVHRPVLEHKEAVPEASRFWGVQITTDGGDMDAYLVHLTQLSLYLVQVRGRALVHNPPEHLQHPTTCSIAAFSRSRWRATPIQRRLKIFDQTLSCPLADAVPILFPEIIRRVPFVKMLVE